MRYATTSKTGPQLITGFASSARREVANKIRRAEIKTFWTVELDWPGVVADVEDIAVVGIVKEGGRVPRVDLGAPGSGLVNIK